MAVTPEFFRSFIESTQEKKHNLASDQLTIALSATANMPDTTNDTVLADITQVAYTNFSSRNLTTLASETGGTTYRLLIDGFALTATGGSGAAFQYVTIYNDTSANDDLICFIDLGSVITLLDGHQLVLAFDEAQGLFQIAPA